MGFLFAYCLNNPLIYTDPTGQTIVGDFFKWVKKNTWDEFWDAANNFAQWADQNGIPAAGYGYNSSLGTYHYLGNSGNVYHSQVRGVNNAPQVTENAVSEAKSQSGGTPWYSIYNWPGAGSSARTMDAIYAGDYVGATGHFLTCAAEVFTLGLASEIKLGTTTIQLGYNAANSSTSLVKTMNQFSKHSLERLAQRGVSPKMAKTAIEKGLKFYDPKNGSINYVLNNGFASGKSLLVGTNPITGQVTTVIRSSKNLVKTRFIPIQ